MEYCVYIYRKYSKCEKPLRSIYIVEPKTNKCIKTQLQQLQAIENEK